MNGHDVMLIKATVTVDEWKDDATHIGGGQVMM
jgi:hypothetical protein